MRIALVNPPPRSELENHWVMFPLLGLAYVAASLRARGHEVVVFDGKLDGLSREQISDGIARLQPGFVGISCMTVEYPTAARIARDLRAAGVDVPIGLGGAHVNGVGARVLEECPEADFACIGEGEHLACELVDALEGRGDVADIAGLAHRVDGDVVRNPPRPYPDDYDALPFPAWDLFNTSTYIPLMTHRGCPFECNFCGHNSGFKPRYRSAANVLDEIEQIVDRFQPEVIRFEDETFGLNMARTKEILAGILDRGLHERVRFSAQTRVDRVDLEFMQTLQRCSFEHLELGVESGSEPVLARMGKGITREQVANAVGLAKQAHLRVWTKFILGHPDETTRDLSETARFITRLSPDKLSVAVMTPYPGTPIYDMAVRGEGGYRLLSRDWGSFDKYASGALELEHARLWQLKTYQLWCYLRMYLWNGRIPELLRYVGSNAGEVFKMARSLAVSLVRRPEPEAAEDAPPAPGALADVAMPDATLERLRQRATRTTSDGPPGDDDSESRLRSWAMPGV